MIYKFCLFLTDELVLFNAADEGDLANVREIIKRNENVNLDFRNGQKDAKTPLHAAAQKGHLQVVIVLIEAGGSIDVEDKFGYTPLYLASLEGHTDVVKYLIGQNADLNAWENYGRSPLWIASFEGHQDIVEMLIR